jgi:hypothetical protein
MCMVPPLDRLASASAVFLGRHGDITQHAQQRGVSRQCLYRQADSVLRDLDASQHQQQIAQLREQLAQLQALLEEFQAVQSSCVIVTAELQAQFASTAQAEGVSLPVARRLLKVFRPDQTPSVAQLGRFSRQAGLRAGPLLKVFDEHARPRAHQGAGDEIFFGQKPVLMVVEPESQCWLSGRLSPSRDGQEWAKELEQLPALEHLVRDGGKGLHNGLARVNQRRRQEEKKPISDQLDHFHTLREGRRALRKTQAKAERAWTAAEEADKKQVRQRRQGNSEAGYATQAVLAWKKAETAFHEWERSEQTLEQIRQALLPFTASGELNSRQRAVAAVEALAEQLHGEQWDKFKRQLRQPETYTYLDRLKGKIEALPVPQEVREAVVQSEGIRQNPELVAGEGPKQAAMRGVLLVCGVLIAQAGQAGQQAVAALRLALGCLGRASSCVEGLNSVVRMQQCRHRKMTQELLDLKRLYWNLRDFRTGSRKNTCPYQRLGVPLPPDLSWWQLLQLTPDQLRSLLSALPTSP